MFFLYCQTQWCKLLHTTQQQRCQSSRITLLINCRGRVSRLRKMSERSANTGKKQLSYALKSRTSKPGVFNFFLFKYISYVCTSYFFLCLSFFFIFLSSHLHSAKIFQKTKCNMCNSPLELPSVHFLCSHSFHQHCFESYAESEAECPTCTPENRKVMDMLRAQDQKRDLHDHFNRQVTGNECTK